MIGANRLDHLVGLYRHAEVTSTGDLAYALERGLDLGHQSLESRFPWECKGFHGRLQLAFLVVFHGLGQKLRKADIGFGYGLNHLFRGMGVHQLIHDAKFLSKLDQIVLDSVLELAVISMSDKEQPDGAPCKTSIFGRLVHDHIKHL